MVLCHTHFACYFLQVFYFLDRSAESSVEPFLGRQDKGGLVSSEKGRRRHHQDMAKDLRSLRHPVAREM